MKPYIILNKKTLFVVIIIIAAALLIFSRAVYLSGKRIDGSNNASRQTYISSLGITNFSGQVKSKEIVIPREFPSVYTEYNELQKKSGFDLQKYKGKSAVLYTYFLENGEAVNLIVHKGQIIGGDISLNNKVLPLTSIEKK